MPHVRIRKTHYVKSHAPNEVWCGKPTRAAPPATSSVQATNDYGRVTCTSCLRGFRQHQRPAFRHENIDELGQ